MNQIIEASHLSPDSLTKTTKPIQVPGLDQVRIRIKYTTFTMNDIQKITGRYYQKKSFPLIPGYEIVGIIDAIGDVTTPTTYKIGDRVAVTVQEGGLQQYINWDIHKLILVPDELPEKVAVRLILPFATAHMLIHKVAKVQPNESVYINGASGSVGTALVLLLKLIPGVKIYGTCSASKFESLRLNGVYPIDYKSDDIYTKIQQATNNQGVDVSFDAISGNTFCISHNVLKTGGRCIGFGIFQPNVNPTISLAHTIGTTILEKIKSLWTNKTSTFYSIEDDYINASEEVLKVIHTVFQLAVQGDLTLPDVDVTLFDNAMEVYPKFLDGSASGLVVIQIFNPTD
ncbi:hypothetical protein BC833DRAFT_532570 [Globomyces pollinis-pini]|nr:hypothetical protein BC833DRAFT_532570 [Globomyces pollinis-pini]